MERPGFRLVGYPGLHEESYRPVDTILEYTLMIFRSILDDIPDGEFRAAVDEIELDSQDDLSDEAQKELYLTMAASTPECVIH